MTQQPFRPFSADDDNAKIIVLTANTGSNADPEDIRVWSLNEYEDLRKLREHCHDIGQVVVQMFDAVHRSVFLVSFLFDELTEDDDPKDQDQGPRTKKTNRPTQPDYDPDRMLVAIINALHSNGPLNEVAAVMILDQVMHPERRKEFIAEYGRFIMRQIDAEYADADRGIVRSTPDEPDE